MIHFLSPRWAGLLFVNLSWLSGHRIERGGVVGIVIWRGVDREVLVQRPPDYFALVFLQGQKCGLVGPDVDLRPDHLLAWGLRLEAGGFV